MKNNGSQFVNNSRTFLILVVMLAAFLSSALVAGAAEDERLEMWEEPSHQLVFVDGPARVLDVRIVPGVTSDFHKHRFATTYVVIQDALVANQYWEKEWSASRPRDYRKPGTTVDQSGYVANPYYHRVRNEDQRAFHVIAVINERSPVDESNVLTRTVNDGAIDNGWFREHRIELADGANSSALRYANDVVVVQPVAGSSHIIEGGISHSFKGSPGAFSWHPAGSEFRIANRSGQRLEFVLIEVKASNIFESLQ
jgi:hypothetical protein